MSNIYKLYLSLKYYFDGGNLRVRKKSTIRNGREGKEKKRRKKRRKGKETRTKAQHNLCTTTLIKDGIIS